MLSRETYIRKSLELNLFFARIMKEHGIFIIASLTPANANLAREADAFKNQFSMLLAETMELAQGNISMAAVSSGELVTKDTLKAEMVTQYYTTIPIDTSLTNAELCLVGDKNPVFMPALDDRVSQLNQKAISLTNAFLQYKTRLVKDTHACKIFTHVYPLLLEHILHEARFYLKTLMLLQNRQEVPVVKEGPEKEKLWNRIMGEHAKFIRGMLDPVEEKLFITANRFGKVFEELTADAAAAAQNPRLLPRVTLESLDTTEDIRDFKRSGTEGLLACKIRSIILPLLSDHVLREANYYIRELQNIRVKL